MNQIIPFEFEKLPIRVVAGKDGEPLFVGKDICDALGYADATTAIRSHCRGVQILHPIPDSLGRKQDTRVLTEPDMMRLIVNSTLPAAEAFERKVFEEILPAIRKTGNYSVKGSAVSAPPSLVQPAKEFRAMFGIARLIGCDKNAAAISANNAVFKVTGTNVMGLLGHTHLESPEQKLYFTPTELGLKLGGISARKMNMLLAEAGLQVKQNDKWEPLPKAEGLCRILDTGKAHGDGTPVQQIKWSDEASALIQQPKAA